MSAPLPNRRVRLRWPAEPDPVWTPRLPELSIAANAVSLLMPFAEPYVVATTRTAVDEQLLADPDLAAEARSYMAQEAQHHGQHQRFNRLLVARYPALRHIERALSWAFAILRRRSTRFGLAFAAGFETIAFTAAGWVDDHQSLLQEAEPTAATLFLWHLSEEVEHKTVAFDVYQASGGGRVRYWCAAWVAGVLLALSALAGTLVMLRGERRLLNPVAHWRLLKWSVSFIFVALPAMTLSALPGHHPSDVPNPAGLEHWLDNLDPETSTVPAWALP